MFYNKFKSGYYFPEIPKKLDGKTVYFPTVVDTEFYTPPFVEQQYQRLPITVQIKPIFAETGMILVKNEFVRCCENFRRGAIDIYNQDFSEIDDFEPLYRHPTASSGVDIVDFLRLQGFDVTITRDLNAHNQATNRTIPRFVWVTYVHFGVADIPLIVSGDYQSDVVEALKKGRIVFRKRLTTKRPYGWNAPWLITINGTTYRFVIKIMDTNAIAGPQTLNSLQELVGSTGVCKQVLVKDDLKKMHLVYLNKSQVFDEYALGDLDVDNILRNFKNQVLDTCSELGLDPIKPAMSLGTTVNLFVQGFLSNETGLSSSDLKKLVEKATPSYLQKQVFNELWRLAKCIGGRAYNAKPTVTNQQGNLVDIDLSGAYTSAMMNLIYAVGNPVIASCNMSLAEFERYITRHGLPRLWFAVIDLPPQNNEFNQDLIPSWHSCKNNMHRRTDAQGYTETGEVDLKSGETHILASEIINGAITSDILDTFRQAKPRSYEKLQANALVKAFIFYPKVCETVDVLELAKVKTFKTTHKKITVVNSQDSHCWYGVKMDKFIGLLKNKRESYEKNHPMERFFKLLLNTIYGSSVSPFFKTSNMVFGNNITGLIRSFMYLAEKGLQMQGTITDGHLFDMNKVLHHKNGKYLNYERINIFYKIPARDIISNNWGHIKSLVIDNQPTCKAALAHLRKLFPKAIVLKNTNFEFEIKDTYTGASYNGTSHYGLHKNGVQVVVKNRGVETKKEADGLLRRPAIAFSNNNFDYNFYSRKTTADMGLNDIYCDPSAVNLYPPYVKKSLLKPPMFRNRVKAFNNSPLIPGDEFLEAKSYKYFVIKQFHWLTLDQYKNWKRDVTYLINKYGYSFELFFLNENGTLDYQKMCVTIDKMVCDGVISPLKFFDKNDNLSREYKTKPRFKIVRDNLIDLNILKDKLKKMNGFILPEGVIEQYPDYDEDLYY